MTKINIDHIISSKLDELNFEFKNEYWEQMEKELSSNCAGEAVTASAGIGTFVSSFLIVTLTTIITLIIIFPWAYDFNNSTNSSNTEIQEDVNIEEVIIPQISTINNAKESSVAAPEEDKNIKTNLQEEKVAPKVKIKRSRKHYSKKSKSISKKTKAASKASSGIIDNPKPAKKEATSIDTYDTTKESIEDTDSIIEEVVIPDSEFDKKQENAKNIAGSNPAIVKEEVVLDNDSVYIPEGKILGDKHEEERPNPQVDVEAGPKPVKTVKPRNKPVKHVFKKRRGLLYRLGLRK